MYEFTTESGRVYRVDVEDQFWHRSPSFYPHRTWALMAGKAKTLPWQDKDNWREGLPEVGEHLYVGDRDEWYVSNRIVSIREI